MSRMNISQALQAALDAASREKDILTVRVLQDEKAAPALSARRVTLPLDGMAQLPFALGCAAAGLQTVLDLTALRDGARRLEAAFAETDRGARRPILMLLSDRYCPSLPGVKLVRPVNSLECAKAVIQAGIKTVIYADDKYADTPAIRASKRMLARAGVAYIPYEKSGRELTLLV